MKIDRILIFGILFAILIAVGGKYVGKFALTSSQKMLAACDQIDPGDLGDDYE